MYRHLPLVAAAASVLGFSLSYAQEAREFREEFTGTALAPEFRVLNPDPNRMAFVDGEHLLLLTRRDPVNTLSYTADLPADYEIIVRFATVPEYEHQYAVVYVGPPDNRVAAGLYMPQWLGLHAYEFYFHKYLGEDQSPIVVEIQKREDLKPFYLKISKDGVEFDASYSYDAQNWSRIGSHVLVKPPSPAFVEVGIWGGDAPESAIRLDSFEVVGRQGR